MPEEPRYPEPDAEPPNYVNDVPEGYCGPRCQYRFERPVKYNGRFVGGRPCGLPDADEDGHCLFHREGDRRAEYLTRALEEAVAAEAYLGEANPSGTNLVRANLSGASLVEANLSGAGLAGGNLSGTKLWWANLSGANLREARFTGEASLRRANLTDASVASAELSPEADLDEVTWWKDARSWWQRLLHLDTPMFRDERDGDFARCERTYRQIKRAYQESGQYDMAGVFFVREMECKRKQAKSIWTRAGYSLAYFLSDYFENPVRVGVISVLIVLAFAWVQGALGICTSGANGEPQPVIGPGLGVPTWADVSAFFSEAWYFSVVTFTTLGYGDYHAGCPAGRVLASFEAIIGAFMMALFLVCLARKYGRS